MMNIPAEGWGEYYFSWNKTKSENYTNPKEKKVLRDNYFWFYQGLSKKGSGKKSWWKLAHLNDKRNEDMIIVGISSHKNPRRYGQSLLFFDKDETKLGFSEFCILITIYTSSSPRTHFLIFLKVLIKNSVKTCAAGDEASYESALVGMYVNPKFRGTSMSSRFLSIWLHICQGKIGF